MRNVIFLILVLGTAVGSTPAQPQNGDLIYSAGAFTGYLNPAQPGTIAMLTPVPTGFFHTGICMAPDNTNLVAGEGTTNTTPWSGNLVMITPGGTKVQVTKALGLAGKLFHLDHDNKWIVGYANQPSPSNNFLYSIDHTTGAVATYWTRTVTNAVNAATIDRDPGSSLPYVIALSGMSTPHIMRADRQGNTTVIVNSSSTPFYTCIEVHPRSGDYILGGWSLGGVTRMTKAGVQKILATGFNVNAIKVTQDDLAWCAIEDSYGRPAALKIDLAQNAVLATVATGLTVGMPLGIEVYGSRTLVCNQVSSSTVKVNVQSHHPQAGNAAYVLAASLARRPGIRFGACSEWLDLNVTDPLFFVSALGLAPSIFSNFQGRLKSLGNASAQVNIPSGLPSGVTVFVAGIIIQNGQVIQVTNSHWFVLP